MPPHNPDTRSGFGDNHAATEDAMLAAHAKHMFKAGLIEKKMAKELSKPRRNHAEMEIDYTSAYLSTFPTYTGQNHDDMPTLEVALRRQAQRDEAQSKMLADYFAGIIDMHGNPIEVEHTGDTTVTANTSPEQSPAKRHRTTKQQKSITPTSSSPSPTSEKSWRIIVPVTPLPGNPNYAEIGYCQLAALCRDRKLPGRGNEQELRNRLIQDDINIAESRSRVTVKSYERKRPYKHLAPKNLGEGVKAGEEGGKEGIVSEESSEGFSPPLKVLRQRAMSKGRPKREGTLVSRLLQTLFYEEGHS